MSKVFITGIAGFLGSHLADRLLEQGHEVEGNDNLIGGYWDNVPADAEFHQVDCKYLNTMHKLLKDVDVVYHTACTAYEGLSVFSPALITENTSQITATVASAAVANGVKRFVNCSSMARYGAQEVPFTEDMSPKPQDPYGIAKVASEQLLWNLSEVHGIDVVNLVPHNIVGPRQKFDDPYRNVASIFINRYLQGKQPVIYGDGEQMRCFSFIEDVVDCFLKAGFQEDLVGETINVGPDEEFVTINDLAETIAGIVGVEFNPTYMDDRPQEVKYATCSADKARRLLGYETKHTLQSGLEQMVEYIQERGPRRFRYHLDLEIVSDKTPRTWKEKLF